MRIRRAAHTIAALGVFAAQASLALQAAAQPGAKPSHAKPAAAAPAKPAKKGGKHAAARKAGEAGHDGGSAPKPPGEPDEATRRVIAGTASRTVRESPELRAMRELDRALFPAVAPGAGMAWVAEGTPLIDRGEPEVLASGMPPASPLAGRDAGPEPVRDLSWLRQLTMPDLPVRWDARVVRYLEFYKNNPRGRSMVAGWVKKSGRYGGAIRRLLRENNLPEDILWLALVESGFDPTIASPAGAAGLWQFMPEGARIYGLTVDRWVDERLDPERSTLAAARYLTDLHTRFGSWELAFAAYNMGYGGLLASIRKYNTNDFWELSRVEAGMPLETALYVPKIVSLAIVAKNRAVFGLDDIELDPAVSFDKVTVRSGVSLQSVALAAGTSTDRIAELNPQLVSGRAPPSLPGGDASWTVHVPVGSAPKAAKSLPQFAEAEPKVERVVVRWGESIDDIAARRHTTRGTLASLNGLHRDESMRPGTVLLVPFHDGAAGGPKPQAPTEPAPRPDDADPFGDAPASKPVVVVPAQSFAVVDPSRKRVFYRAVSGDTLREVASLFGVTPDDLCRWNDIDPAALLHEGMALQIYPVPGAPRADVLVLEEKDARVLPVGSPEFFAHFEGQRGRTRLELVVKDRDTWRTLAHKYGLSVAQLERINGRGRSTPLNPGDRLVVYVTNTKAPATGAQTPTAKPGKETAEERAPEVVAMTKPIEAGAPMVEDGAGKEDGAVKAATVLVPVSLGAGAGAVSQKLGQERLRAPSP